jgi:uncharacterized membrane protein
MTDTVDHINTKHQERLSFPVIAAWLVLLLVVGMYIRVHGATERQFNIDEHWHIGIASGDSLADVLRYSRVEVHPPLFYILLHYWMQISDTPAFMRGFSLLLSILLIPLYYLIGRKMAGVWCGLCCATLIAFSPGCIYQSYNMRHYGVLMSLISLCFYCYLYWRETRGRLLLLGYTMLGLLAVSTHFSAVFCIFCIALFETLDMLGRKAERRMVLEWGLANLAVAMVAMCLYDIWQPSLAHYGHFLTNCANCPTVEQSHNTQWMLIHTLAAPFIAMYYFLPLPLAVPPMLIIAESSFYDGRRTFPRYPIAIACIACVLSMALYGSGFYPRLGLRHNLWMLPLIVPAAGGVMAIVLEAVWRHHIMPVVMLITVAVMTALFGRFSDMTEYGEWQYGMTPQMLEEINALGPRDLVIADYFANSMLINVPSYRSDGATGDEKKPLLVPYRDTHLLVSRVSLNHWGLGRDELLAAMQQILSEHKPGEVDRLVFVKSHFPSVFSNLVVCKTLDKDMLYPSPSETFFQKETIQPGSFAVFTVARKVLLDELLAPSGKARECLDK